MTAPANSRRAPALTPRCYSHSCAAPWVRRWISIRALPHRRLTEQVSIQGYDTTVLSAIFHVVEHFSGHTYQIILLTKRFTGKDLGFYRYLDKTGRREADESTDLSVERADQAWGLTIPCIVSQLTKALNQPVLVVSLGYMPKP